MQHSWRSCGRTSLGLGRGRISGAPQGAAGDFVFGHLFARMLGILIVVMPRRSASQLPVNDRMTNSYEGIKGLSYHVLATIASCDHSKAKAHGYKDGWQMLLDKHDGNEMAVFCASLPEAISQAQATVLLDGLAREYTQFATWPEFVDACCEHPNWKPSKGPIPGPQGAGAR